MAGILDLMGYIQDQGDRGRAQGLAKLVGSAYTAPPEQRQQILGTVAARGGLDMAANAQTHFDKLDESARTKLGQYAVAFDALPDDQKAQAYPMFAQQAQQLGLPAPPQWDPAFAPNIQKLAQALGGGAAAQAPSSVQEYQYAQAHPGFQDFLNGRQPTQLTSIPVPGGMQTIQWNPRTKQMTDLAGNPIGQDGGGISDFRVESGADIPPGDMPAVMAAAQHPGQVFTPQGRIGFKPDAPKAPSALQEKIAIARSMGATDDQVRAMVLGGDSGQGASQVPGDTSQTGNAYLASLDAPTAAQVRALAEGRMAFPSGTALKSAHWQAMLGAVSQYDPSFDAINYNARSKTRSAFTSGPEAKTINALNTVAEHLGQFSDNSAALDNFSHLGPLTQLANRAKNAYLDYSGDPRIAAFNTNKKAVADEVAKVWRASGGSEADIQENLKNLDSAQSPEQLNAAIGTLTDLIYGKIAALQDQYTSGMGTSQAPRPLVSPEAQAAFDKTLRRMSGATAAPSPAQPSSVDDLLSKYGVK